MQLKYCFQPIFNFLIILKFLDLVLGFRIAEAKQRFNAKALKQRFNAKALNQYIKIGTLKTFKAL